MAILLKSIVFGLLETVGVVLLLLVTFFSYALYARHSAGETGRFVSTTTVFVGGFHPTILLPFAAIFLLATSITYLALRLRASESESE